jgi:hypothetical protein
MRALHFSPLWRYRLFDLINDEMPRIEDTCPPCVVVRMGGEGCRISIASSDLRPGS